MLLESPVLQTLSGRSTIPDLTVIDTGTIKIMQRMLQHILDIRKKLQRKSMI
jgi:hypothetical protein